MTRIVTLAVLRWTTATLLTSLSMLAPALAQNAFWHGVRSTSWHDGNVGGSSNWYSEAPAAGDPLNPPTRIAKFASGAVRKQVTIDQNVRIKTIWFFPGVEQYEFITNDAIFRITGKGIVNNAASIPLFTVASRGKLFFFGNATIQGPGPVIESRNAGSTGFYNTTSGGNAVVRNYNRSTLSFSNSSSADRMTISNLSSKSLIVFFDDSTAGRAKIYNTRGKLVFNIRDGSVGSIFNSDRISVRGSTHLLVFGRLLLEPRGSLQLNIGSKITVDRHAKLRGILSVTGTPTAKTSYVLLTAGSRTGRFNSITFGTKFATRNPRVRYRGTKVVLLLDPLP